MLMTEEFEILFKKVQRFCNYQDRNTEEVKTKIASLTLDKATQDALYQFSLEESLFDDNIYLKKYTLGKHNSNQWGPIKIKYSLQSKGFTSVQIDYALSFLSETVIKETIQHLYKKRLKQRPKDNSYQHCKFFVDKGYAYSTIQSVLNL